MAEPEEATVKGGGMTPSEEAAATRQAQFSLSNDMPIDVNMNAALARIQGLTFALAGGNFQSNADFRQKMQDRLLFVSVKPAV